MGNYTPQSGYDTISDATVDGVVTALITLSSFIGIIIILNIIYYFYHKYKKIN